MTTDEKIDHLYQHINKLWRHCHLADARFQALQVYVSACNAVINDHQKLDLAIHNAKEHVYAVWNSKPVSDEFLEEFERHFTALLPPRSQQK